MVIITGSAVCAMIGKKEKRQKGKTNFTLPFNLNTIFLVSSFIAYFNFFTLLPFYFFTFLPFLNRWDGCS